MPLERVAFETRKCLVRIKLADLEVRSHHFCTPRGDSNQSIPLIRPGQSNLSKLPATQVGPNAFPGSFKILSPSVALDILHHQRLFIEGVKRLKAVFDEIPASAQPCVILDLGTQQKLCTRAAETKFDDCSGKPVIRLRQCASLRLSQNSTARVNKSLHLGSFERTLVSANLDITAGWRNAP
eukprot:11640232-Karenia_brevis.AAC.1